MFTFYKMFKPTTYNALKVAMTDAAASQSPNETGKVIAEDIAANVLFPATNNRATWDSSKTRNYYEVLATALDDGETALRRKAALFDGNEDWEIDCGLMATLVKQHGGGNCDDLASYALDYGMRNHSECVLAFTQHDGFDHSIRPHVLQGRRRHMAG
ncbi:MAG: hypothetical protein QM784_09810 [Polyangiaceae bacterium]